MVNVIIDLTDNGLAAIEHCQADLNHDGVIDILDILTLVNTILNT